MAKASKSKKAAPSVEASSFPPARVAHAVDPFGPTEQRKISKSKVLISKYYLEDGTVLEVKPMVSDVRRALNQFNQDGDPLYFMAAGMNLKTVAPAKLKNKATASVSPRGSKKGAKKKGKKP